MNAPNALQNIRSKHPVAYVVLYLFVGWALLVVITLSLIHISRRESGADVLPQSIYMSSNTNRTQRLCKVELCKVA